MTALLLHPQDLSSDPNDSSFHSTDVSGSDTEDSEVNSVADEEISREEVETLEIESKFGHQAAEQDDDGLFFSSKSS